MNSMKLMPRLHGPWEVKSQYKNDVKAVHMATKEEDMFHVEELTRMQQKRQRCWIMILFTLIQLWHTEVTLFTERPWSL